MHYDCLPCMFLFFLGKHGIKKSSSCWPGHAGLAKSACYCTTLLGCLCSAMETARIFFIQLPSQCHNKKFQHFSPGRTLFPTAESTTSLTGCLEMLTGHRISGKAATKDRVRQKEKSVFQPILFWLKRGNKSVARRMPKSHLNNLLTGPCCYGQVSWRDRSKHLCFELTFVHCFQGLFFLFWYKFVFSAKDTEERKESCIKTFNSFIKGR